MPSRAESFPKTFTSVQISAECAEIVLRISAYVQRRASSSGDSARKIECAVEAVAREMTMYAPVGGEPPPAVVDLAAQLLESKNQLRGWAVACRKAGVPEHVVGAWLRGAAFHLVNDTEEVPGC